MRKMLTTKHGRNDDSREFGYSSARNCLTATVRINSIRGNNVNRSTITMVRLMYYYNLGYDVIIMYV